MSFSYCDTDGNRTSVIKVVFDPSFADAHLETTWGWFCRMRNLETIVGLTFS